MNFSYWEFDFYLKSIDFAVIGGGIVGMSSAYHLKKKYPESRIVVFERDFLSAGASSRNAGFACFGSPTEILADVEINGWDAVMETVYHRYHGLQILQSIIPMSAMEGFQNGGLEIFEKEESQQLEDTLSQLEELNRRVHSVLHFSPYHISRTDYGFKNVSGAIHIDQEGMIHPGKMLGHWIQLNRSMGIEILYGLNIDEVDTESGAIKIRNRWFHPHRLVLCTNGLTPALVEGLDVHPARNQVLVTEEILERPWNQTFHLREGYVYFRNIGKRILIGGGRDIFREQENTMSLDETENVRVYLHQKLETLLGRSVKIEHHWSGIMGLGQAKGPIIRPLSEKTYVAVRMGGMGVAIGTWVGQKLANMME